MNMKLRLIALLLVVMMLLTSCSLSLDTLLEYIPEGILPEGFLPTTTTTTTTTTPTTTTTTTTTGITVPSVPKFSRSKSSLNVAQLTEKYTLTQSYVDETLALLETMVETSKTAATVEEIDVLYDEFETRFYYVAQQMTIATIIYYCNMSDYKATNRYTKATDMFYDMQDKYTTACREMYQESPHAAELFDGWSEEEIQSLLDYDPITVQLRKEIDELQVQYNNLSGDSYTDESALIYAKLVTKSNQLAAFYGYDNYYDYAAENVYGREYDRKDLEDYREYILKYVLPHFNNLNDGWRALYNLEPEEKKLTINFLTAKFDGLDQNYLVNYLNSLEGTMGESMRHMFENKNCIFAGSPNSHPTAFCTYLYDDEQPFCLFGSDGQTSTTLAHEIGHYYQNLKNPDISNYDLCETHSQSNEYFFITYCKDYLPEGVYDASRAYQLFNAYYIIIFAAIIDEFEQAIYTLDSVEDYTSAEFDAIMTNICEKYGGVEWLAENLADPLEYWRMVAIDNPVYYISYSVSAISSLEILALAEEDRAAALTAYTTLVEGVTEEDGFLGALEIAGLTSPFSEETFIAIDKILSE